MNVAVDASCLLLNPYSGLSKVVHNLLLNLPGAAPDVKISLFLNYFRKHPSGCLHSYPQTTAIHYKVPRRIFDLIWSIDQLPFDKFLKGNEIFHSLYMQVPPLKKAKSILTIHDCRYLACPELYRSDEVKKYKKTLEQSLRRVDYVTTVSAFTRQEVINYFAFPQDRIAAILNGFSAIEIDVGSRSAGSDFTGQAIPGPYLLYTGVLDPRKNLERLVAAFALCKQKNRDFPFLVIAGVDPAQWHRTAVAAKARMHKIEDSIIVSGPVDESSLTRLIKNAHGSCYISLYEGFGFPPLEAMAQGVPVIAANSSSIPEIVGQAACLVDAMNVDEISNGLNEIVYNHSFRQTLIDEGYRQVKKYSWSKAAKEYVNIYKLVNSL